MLILGLYYAYFKNSHNKVLVTFSLKQLQIISRTLFQGILTGLKIFIEM